MNILITTFSKFGNIPTGRCAHSLTYISDKLAMLIGGTELKEQLFSSAP